MASAIANTNNSHYSHSMPYTPLPHAHTRNTAPGPQPGPQPGPNPVPNPGPAAAAHLPCPPLHSESLLCGHREREIHHGEAVYRLRLTSLGKLILTK